MGTRRCPRARAEFSSPTSPMRAASPRPSRDRCTSSGMLKLHLPAPVGATLDRRNRTTIGIHSSCGGERPFALDDLRRKLEVGLAARAFQVVEQNRLAVG